MNEIPFIMAERDFFFVVWIYDVGMAGILECESHRTDDAEDVSV